MVKRRICLPKNDFSGSAEIQSAKFCKVVPLCSSCAVHTSNFVSPLIFSLTEVQCYQVKSRYFHFSKHNAVDQPQFDVCTKNKEITHSYTNLILLSIAGNLVVIAFKNATASSVYTVQSMQCKIRLN